MLAVLIQRRGWCCCHILCWATLCAQWGLLLTLLHLPPCHSAGQGIHYNHGIHFAIKEIFLDSNLTLKDFGQSIEFHLIPSNDQNDERQTVLLTPIFKLEGCCQISPLQAFVSDNAVHCWIFAVCVDSEHAGGITCFTIHFKVMVSSAYVAS